MRTIHFFSTWLLTSVVAILAAVTLESVWVMLSPGQFSDIGLGPLIQGVYEGIVRFAGPGLFAGVVLAGLATVGPKPDVCPSVITGNLFRRTGLAVLVAAPLGAFLVLQQQAAAAQLIGGVAIGIAMIAGAQNIWQHRQAGTCAR